MGGFLENLGGRPRKDFDWVLLDSLLPLKASLDYCCERLLVKEGSEVTAKSIKTMQKMVERRIRERFECSFVEYRDKKMEATRVQIFAAQLDAALKGKDRALLIWLGKAELGQREASDLRITKEQVLAGATTDEIVTAAERQIEKLRIAK